MNLLSTGRNTGFEKVLKYYQNPDKPVRLTEKQEELRFLYELADRLLVNNTPAQAANMIRARYRKKISRSKAYRVVSESMILFGDIRKTKKDALKNFLIERQLNLAQKAEKDGDFATAERCYESVGKWGGLQNEDFDLADMYKKLQLPAIIFTTNPEVLKQLPEEGDVLDITHEEGE